MPMKLSMSRVKQPKKFDFFLTTILILIFFASLLAIYAATPLMSATVIASNPLLKQIIFYLLGIFIIASIVYIGNDTVYNFINLAYFILLGMLVYLFVDLMLQKVLGVAGTGRTILPFVWYANGATSWFDFPVIGNLQPSEFMKVILIIKSAIIIKEHNENKVVDSFNEDINLMVEIGKWAILPLLLILLQPDTGIFLIIVCAIAIMLAIGGIRKEWMIGFVVIAVIGLGIFLAIFYLNQPLFTKIFGSSYRMQRIYGWLQAEKFSSSLGHQLFTSLLSIGSSGLTGHGIQSSLISIPEPHTDFIFAVIGLNFGFIGCILVVTFCLALDIRLVIIASRTNDVVEKLMISGFLGMLIIQQIQNIGMTLGLLPITGITLPLISAGGSSLLSYMIAFGIVYNASAKAKKLSDYVYN